MSQRYPRDLKASWNTYTLCHYLQTPKYSITKNQLSWFPMLCTLARTIARVIDVWPYHSGGWEAHNIQITKSCFLRRKSYGLDGNILRLHLAHSLIAEPYFQKQIGEPLNTVSKASQLLQYRKKHDQKSALAGLSFLIENKYSNSNTHQDLKPEEADLF